MAITKPNSKATGKTAAGKTATATPAPAAPPPAQTAAASTGKYASLDPSTFTAGGLIDDVDATMTDVLACEWDYNGQQAPGPALAIEFTDPAGQAHIQYFSAGKLEDWKPDASGEGFIPVSGKTGFTSSTNLAMFLDSLIKAGFPTALLADGNVKRMIGTQVHVVQHITERKGLIRTGKNADRPPSVLLVTKLIALPGQTPAPVPASAQPPAQPAQQPAATAAARVAQADSTPPTNGSVEGTVDDHIVAALMEKLMEDPTAAIDKKDATKIVFQYFAAHNLPAKDRNGAVVKMSQAPFLQSLAAQGIAYNGSQLSLQTS